MDIEELTKRLEFMCKLAEYNQKIRDDYDKGISAVLEGTQKVIDFITKNTTTTPSIKSVEPIVDIATNDPKVKLAEKGIEMLFQEPKEPINPIDQAVKVEPDIDLIAIMRVLFQKVGELRKIINESDIGLVEKYEFEKYIYDLQKIIWDSIKNR